MGRIFIVGVLVVDGLVVDGLNGLVWLLKSRGYVLLPELGWLWQPKPGITHTLDMQADEWAAMRLLFDVGYGGLYFDKARVQTRWEQKNGERGRVRDRGFEREKVIYELTHDKPDVLVWLEAKAIREGDE